MSICARCGDEAKFWYKKDWLCWEHYWSLTAVVRVSNYNGWDTLDNTAVQ